VTLARVRLRAQAWWLLVISGTFALSVALSNTFVNVYLWKVDRSFTAIGWYNLVIYCTIPLTFIGAGWIAKRLHSVWTLRIGILLHAIFYLIALLGGTFAANLPALLGSIMGLAAGFYWFSFNQLSLQFTQFDSRDRFYGLNGVMGAVAGIIAPPVAGFLISYEDRFGGLSGYHVIFGLSLALFVGATFFSMKLHVQVVGEHLHLLQSFSALRQKRWRLTLLGCSIYGLRQGVFLFLIGLLMYIATSSELKLGEFVLIQSALSFLAFFVVSRLVKPANRLRFLGAGAVAMALAALLFLLPLKPRNILWYGAVISVCLPFFLVPLQSFIFDAISHLERSQSSRMEHIIVRELFENIGRVTGILLFIILVTLDPSARMIPTFAVVLGFVQIGTWVLIKKGSGSDGETPTGEQNLHRQAAEASKQRLFRDKIST
jgi:YQGE family putative transporter